MLSALDQIEGQAILPVPMIVASNLTKFYGTHPAIRDLSFEINEGEIVGFLGLNGAGKSTTLRIISCQLVPTAGTVTVAGYNVLESSEEIRRRIGYLPEVPPLYSEMTVHSFLEFVAQLKGVPKAEVARRVAEVEELTRITDVAQQVIGTLSAGYRQRVGIAQAVVHKPSLLILDEPFAGLDPVQTVEMREMIRKLGGDHTVLLSSHLLSQIHGTCDRILVIQKGRLAAQGSEDELVARMRGAAEVQIEMLVRGSHEEVERAIMPKDLSRRIIGVIKTELSTKHLGVGFTRVTITVDENVFEPLVSSDGAREHHDAREALAAAIVEAGLGLREMKLKRSSEGLEAAFIELTRTAQANLKVEPEAADRSDAGAGSKESSEAGEEETAVAEETSDEDVEKTADDDEKDPKRDEEAS